MDQVSTKICEETGERSFQAGTCVVPGVYMEAAAGGRAPLHHPSCLLASRSGHVGGHPQRPYRGRDQATSLAVRQRQFETLFQRCRSRVYNLAYRALGNSMDAEDVTQETCLRAWGKFHCFDAERSFEAWVFRIATNLCIDHSRSRKRRQVVQMDASVADRGIEDDCAIFQVPDRAYNPEDCLMAKEISEEALTALHSLPAVYRMTMMMVEQERSYEQIAQIMNCPVGTVRSRVHRARVILQLALAYKGYVG